MLRREFLQTLPASAALAAAAPPTQARPNILHIQSDQQQWATIANRSLCRTPNLNRLASEGMLFERSYTPCAVCCPSRAITLSGAYHWKNGVYNQVHSPPSVHRDLNPDTVLYSQRLKAAGYRAGYVGKWHCSYLRSPADFGYECAGVFGCDPKILARLDLNPDRVPEPRKKEQLHPQRMFQWPGSAPFPMWGYRETPEKETPEAFSTECAIRMMRRYARSQQPWLLELQFVQPHDPYAPLKKYLDRYNPREIPVPKSFYDRFDGKPGLHRRESATWGHVTEDDYRNGRAHYFAYAEQLDYQIGRVLKALDDTGQSANTIVVFTSDHGDMNGAHRMWIKGWMPYEDCYRIPLMIRWPERIKAGTKTSALAGLQDLAHTYTDVAGAQPMPYAHGRSLAPLFSNPSPANWRDTLLTAFYGGEFLYTQRMAISDRHKYVFNGFDIDEMYDLHEDPEEMHNIAYDSNYKAEVGDMQARLYELMTQFQDPYVDKDRYGAMRYLPRGSRLPGSAS